MFEASDQAQVGESTAPGRSSLAFLRRFIHHPKQIGSIIPSSRFLERRLVKLGAVAEANTVVELGPGTGGTTRALLRALPAQGKLLAMEIDPVFSDMLRTGIRDPRLIVHEATAEQIVAAIESHHLPAPELVISGIPFSTMPRECGIRIMRAIRSVMAPGGRFIAYQVSSRVAELGLEAFYRGADRHVELLNVPPVRVYCWRKGRKET